MQTGNKAKTVPNSAKQCQTTVFYTPRFSYSVLETVICACPGSPVAVVVHRAGRRPCWSWVPGGYWEGIPRWVLGGLYRVPTQPLLALSPEEPTQRSGPRKALQGPGVGGVGGGRATPSRTLNIGHSQVRPGPLPALQAGSPVGPPAGPSLAFLEQKGEITPHFSKS